MDRLEWPSDPVVEPLHRAHRIAHEIRELDVHDPTRQRAGLLALHQREQQQPEP